jgi:hypothetical protein
MVNQTRKTWIHPATARANGLHSICGELPPIIRDNPLVCLHVCSFGWLSLNSRAMRHPAGPRFLQRAEGSPWNDAEIWQIPSPECLFVFAMQNFRNKVAPAIPVSRRIALKCAAAHNFINGLDSLRWAPKCWATPYPLLRAATAGCDPGKYRRQAS